MLFSTDFKVYCLQMKNVYIWKNMILYKYFSQFSEYHKPWNNKNLNNMDWQSKILKKSGHSTVVHTNYPDRNPGSKYSTIYCIFLWHWTTSKTPSLKKIPKFQKQDFVLVMHIKENVSCCMLKNGSAENAGQIPVPFRFFSCMTRWMYFLLPSENKLPGNNSISQFS